MITFPTNCDTPRKKAEYCFIAIEKLRLLHNFFGEWYVNGKTLSNWNNLPQKIKNRFPYKDQLSEQDLKNFKMTIFSVLEEKIYDALNNQLESLRNSVEWTPDIDDILD